MTFVVSSMWYLYTLLYCTLCTVHFGCYRMTFVVSSKWYLLAGKLACQNKQPRCHTWLFSPLVFTSKNNTFYIHFLDIELKTLWYMQYLAWYLFLFQKQYNKINWLFDWQMSITWARFLFQKQDNKSNWLFDWPMFITWARFLFQKQYN